MDYLGLNIKHLRKSKGLTQSELAKNIGVNRAMIGSYEENRAVPKLSVLQDIAYFFSISIDDLIKLNLDKDSFSAIDINGSKLRIITTVVDKEDKELITTVPIKASAGYTNGYSDPEFVEELPHFSLPLTELSKERTYRFFQIKGDSMLPIKSGSYIICEYLANWENIIDNQPYILISKDEGIVYKRILNNVNKSEEFILKSDNPEYEAYTIKINEVLEIWKALGFISFSLPESDSNNLDINKLHNMILDLKKDVDTLKS
ncbi:MAG: helix-turn-helix domain-containing protein [Bacteroidales bacterium]|jgi:transcriptional regulator with XRE-family HTH domain|nr:helix-turn-helix domain-containing protein [Bacteroidales bacterium]